MSLISIIVPVYNIVQYLPQCVDNLLAQTLRDIEILLVDDGSTDTSGQLCDRYAEKDGRVRVIHQENRGLSAARNAGIEAATSDWLMFVDGDDWVEPDYCLAPYTAAQEYQADIVMFPYWDCYDDSKKLRQFQVSNTLLEKSEAIEMILRTPTVWNKLYRKVLFHEIRFPEGKLFEDTATTYRLIHQAERVYYLNRPLYCYRKNRPGSIMSSLTREMTEEHYQVRHQRHEQLRQWGYEIADEENRMAMNCLIQLGRKSPLSERYASKLRGMKAAPSFFGKRSRILFYLLRFSPPLFDLACVVSGKRIR